MIKFGSTVRVFERLQIKSSSTTPTHLVSSDLLFYTNNQNSALTLQDKGKDDREKAAVAFTTT
jgi:hypothetical protein